MKTKPNPLDSWNERIYAERKVIAERLAVLTGNSPGAIYNWLTTTGTGNVRAKEMVRTLEEAAALRAEIAGIS